MNISIKNSEKADKFAYIFQHMKLFTEQVNVMFEEGRVYIQAMDSARVSIFEIEIAAEWFDEYKRDSDHNLCLGINSSILYKILNTRDKTQSLSIIYSEENSDKLEIRFTGGSKSIFDKQFAAPLIDIEEQIMEIPENDSHAEISINATNFANTISQLKLFGDTLDISCSEEEILFCSNSVDVGQMTVQIGMDDLDEFSINDGANLKLSFSLTHLHNICMYHKICKDLNIKWINEYPMQLTYNIDDSQVKLRFYLAPKFTDA
jgi:proliferating cell nuclear antigen PCNA